MSCNLTEWEFKKYYPYPVHSLFMSWSGSAIGNSNIGMISELERLGSATAAPAYRQLRPLARLDGIENNNVKALLEKIEFWPYDTTKTGSAHQDAATLTAIYASRTANEAIPQSLYLNAMVMNWQPNFCRPSVRINNVEYFCGLDSTYYSADNFANLGDKSIGIPLPFCLDVNVQVENVKKIEIHSALAQYIATTALFQNYALLCKITWWTGPGLPDDRT
jgi:hypothetical protein